MQCPDDCAPLYRLPVYRLRVTQHAITHHLEHPVGVWMRYGKEEPHETCLRRASWGKGTVYHWSLPPECSVHIKSWWASKEGSPSREMLSQPSKKWTWDTKLVVSNLNVHTPLLIQPLTCKPNVACRAISFGLLESPGVGKFGGRRAVAINTAKPYLLLATHAPFCPTWLNWGWDIPHSSGRVESGLSCPLTLSGWPDGAQQCCPGRWIKATGQIWPMDGLRTAHPAQQRKKIELLHINRNFFDVLSVAALSSLLNLALFFFRTGEQLRVSEH